MKKIFAILIALCLFSSFAAAEEAPAPAAETASGPGADELVVLQVPRFRARC